MFPKLYSAHRRTIEQLAQQAICACYYYDFVDCIDEMSDEELVTIIANEGVDCPTCS